VLGLLAYTKFSGGSLAQVVLAGVLGFGLALEAAISLVNWNVTHRIKPQSLPRMDFSEGLPPGNRTMVVVPALLENAGEINHLSGTTVKVSETKVPRSRAPIVASRVMGPLK